MRYFIEMFKDDPMEFIGNLVAWSSLGVLIFMMTVIGG